MQGPQTWNYRTLAEACKARGLALPRASLVTLSLPVITHFLSGGQFITAMPRSVAYSKSLKVLPVDLPVRPWPVNLVTVKFPCLRGRIRYRLGRADCSLPALSRRDGNR